MDDDEDHHSDDSCLLHEYTSPNCGRGVAPPAINARRPRPTMSRPNLSNPCCSTSTTRIPNPILTSSRPVTRLGSFEDLNSRIESLRRDVRRDPNPLPDPVDDPDAIPVPCCCSSRWDVRLLRELRRDPNSVPERRSDGSGGSSSRRMTRIRQPGRADVGFTPRKGDLIIHHERKPGRRVLEFYDPICQRLHDGDILVRFKIDSYACEGIVLVKGAGYLYHRGFWVYLGKDSDQIARSCRAW